MINEQIKRYCPDATGKQINLIKRFRSNGWSLVGTGMDGSVLMEKESTPWDIDSLLIERNGRTTLS